MTHKLILSTFIVVGLLGSCTKKNADEKHQSSAGIFDNAFILTEPQKDSISRLITTLESQVGSQIAIVTIVTLDGQTIEQFSYETFRKMDLGRSTYNDGILITVATAERMLRIEVGTGLENIIRDEVAGRIRRNVLNPNFAEGKYKRGLYAALDSISRLISDHRDMVGQKPTWK